MSPLLARVRAFLSTWFGNFQYQTFFLTITSACGLAKEVSDWANVPTDAKPFVIALFGIAVGFAFVLNPKSVGWVGDAKSTVHAVRTGDYDAVADLIDPMDEAHDKDPDAQLPLPLGFDPYSNSSEQEGK